MGLTDQKLKSLKGRRKRYEIADAHGLGVRVTPRGTITFQIRYRFYGKLCRHDLGTYPLTTLSEARDRHRVAQKLLDDGKNPADVKRQSELDDQDAWTIEELIEDFLDRKLRRERKRPEYAEYLLRKNVIPEIGNRKVQSVSTREIVQLLERIVDRGAPVLANRAASLLKQMFSYAVQRGLRSDNPCSVITKTSIGGRETPRSRFLTYAEIWRLWKALEGSSVSPPMKIAAKLLLATGQRRGELVFGEWSHIDLPHGIWRIPSSLSKNGRPHLVFLSGLAVDLFNELRSHAGDSKYLFPSSRPDLDQPCEERALNKVLAKITSKLDIKGCSPHVLRHTFSTLVSGLGVPLHVIEKILNHSLGGMLAVYNHQEFLPERKQALNAWTDRLITLMKAQPIAEVAMLETVWSERTELLRPMLGNGPELIDHQRLDDAIAAVVQADRRTSPSMGTSSTNT
jgi:integrase